MREVENSEMSFGLAIIVDLEGCAGVTRFLETFDRADDFETARRRMTAELNAAVEGAIAGGADRDRIYAVDIHWDGRSLLIDEMHEDCQLLRGGRFPAWRAEVYKKVNAVAYLGLYAPAGSPGVLAHTQDFQIQYMEVNGEFWGDAIVESMLASSHSGAVPIFAAGDQYALESYRRFYPSVEQVQTKLAIDASSAICPHPGRINRAISEKMKLACERYSTDGLSFGEPHHVAERFDVAIGLGTSEMADAVATLLPHAVRGQRHEVCRTFTGSDTAPLDLANFLVGAALISRAADDGRGGST